MARKKGSKNKKHVFPDPQIEEIVEVEIEYICPKRGKVKQKVKMKKLKPVKVDPIYKINSLDSIPEIEDDNSLLEFSTEDLEEETYD